MRWIIGTTVVISCIFLHRMEKDKISHLKEVIKLKKENLSLKDEMYAKDSLILNADEFFPNNKTKDIVKFKKNYNSIKRNN